MATTTNFGWETPDDTDLVKDGAAAMRTLGNSIDTSFVDLKGGTTGQVLAKASNTDLDYTWVAQDDSNAIQNAIVDAKGDLISATAADTPARLAVGTNGQVLSANSSTATGLEWTTISAGGETLISTTTLSGSNVDLTSIPQTYKHLRMEISGLVSTSTGCRLFVRINSDTTAVYNWSNASLSDGVANNLYTEADSRFDYIGWAADNGASNDDKGYIIIDFWDYTSTTTKKFVTSRASVRQSNVLKHGDFTGIYFGAFDYAITTINLTGACGASTLAGGTVKLYGIK